MWIVDTTAIGASGEDAIAKSGGSIGLRYGNVNLQQAINFDRDLHAAWRNLSSLYLSSSLRAAELTFNQSTVRERIGVSAQGRVGGRTAKDLNLPDRHPRLVFVRCPGRRWFMWGVKSRRGDQSGSICSFDDGLGSLS